MIYAKSVLSEQVRQTCRQKHFSLKTKKAYSIRRFILFNNKRHPEEIGEEEISNSLSITKMFYLFDL